MAQQSAKHTVLEESVTLDTDVHATITDEHVARYCDEPFKSHMLKCYGGPLPADGWDPTLGGKIDQDTLETPEAIEDVCENFHIDHPILNTHTKINRLPKKKLAVHLMKAYNDAFVTDFLDHMDDAYGLINIATQKPDKAAEEMDRWADEDQIVGVYIVNAGPQIPLGDEFYDPLYRAAEENDLTVTFHSSSGAFMFDFPKQNQGLEEYIEVNTLCHPYSHMLTATSMICQGVPVKFPDLDFVFLEAGQGWVPLTMFRLNKEYDMRRSEAPLLERSPEEYMRDFYYGTQPLDEPNDPEHLMQLLRMIGTDSVTFSSDLPHWNFDNPEAIDQYFTQFSPEERGNILNGNAAEAYGISL